MCKHQEMTRERAEKFAKELLGLCYKHGVALIGSCSAEGCFGEIAIEDAMDVLHPANPQIRGNKPGAYVILDDDLFFMRTVVPESPELLPTLEGVGFTKDKFDG